MTENEHDAQALTVVTALLRERAFEAQRRQQDALHRIEGEISEIDRLRTEARLHAGLQDAARTIGADILWGDWILQRRADLLREAAIARARQAETLQRARAAFARHQATLAMAKAAQDAGRARRLAADLASLEDQMVLKALWSKGSAE